MLLLLRHRQHLRLPNPHCRNLTIYNKLIADFTPNTPGPANVGLGDVQEGKFVDGKWVVLRQLAGDDTAQGEILVLRPNTILRVTLYRYP